MRLDLLFGFLGSGKTTLASRILKEWGGKAKLALIVNEFGEVGVDGDILRGGAIDTIELSSGCLCCTLKGSLLNAIEELAGRGADHIVVEATGVASPEELLENFQGEPLMEKAECGPITTVIDAAKFLKIKDMLGDFYGSQIAYCDLIVLNKVDLADADLLEKVRDEVRALNPYAQVRFAEHCDIDLDEIMSAGPSPTAKDFLGPTDVDHHHDGDHEGHEHHHHGDEHGDHDHLHAPADSFVIDIAGDMSAAAFCGVMKAMPDGLWRAKGFVRLDGRDRLIQYAMGDLDISECAARQRRYLVFIGKGLDEAAITAAIGTLGSQGALQ